MHWIAKYKDGSTAEEGAVPYSHLRRDVLASFAIYDDAGVMFELHVEACQEVFWRRRVWMCDGNRKEMHIVGWRSESGISINFVFPDGHVEQRSTWIEGHPWADPIVPLPCEERMVAAYV